MNWRRHSPERAEMMEGWWRRGLLLIVVCTYVGYTEGTGRGASAVRDLTKDEVRKFLAAKSIDVLDHIRPSIDETLLMGLVSGEAITRRDKTNIEEAGNRGQRTDKLFSLIQAPKKFNNFRKVLIEREDNYLEDLITEYFSNEPHKMYEVQGGSATTGAGGTKDRPIIQMTPRVVNALLAENQGDEEPYKMTSKPRGRAIIFNFNKFRTMKGTEERTGTLVDAEKLRSLFEELGFTVVTHTDASAADIRDIIKKEQSHGDHKTSDAFVMCIMSHGSKGNVIDKSGVRMNIMKTFLNPFKSNVAKDLANKPKLFFIQACRKEGADTDAEEIDAPPKFGHEMADFLMGYSSAEGYLSYRMGSGSGSYFINELVSVFRERSHKDHVNDMMTVVTDRMNNRDQQALSSTTSQLRRKLFFFPGHSKNEKSEL